MPTERRLQKLKAVAAARQAGLAIVLEDIHDPHNAAAALRSCDAFGVQDVHFVFEKEKPFNPKKIGKVTSASANKWLTFMTSRSITQTIASLKRRGYQIIATVAGPDTENIFTAKLLNKKIAVLIGNEHRGLSAKAIQRADRRLTIPMAGMVQSLNLSVTTALFLFEIVRQRSKKQSRYRLTKKDVAKLTKQFIHQ